jgi:hypothetical protein
VIIISPSRGNGAVSLGAKAILFDGEYAADISNPLSAFYLRRDGSASGRWHTASGPGSWTWLLEGGAPDFQVYCQPKSGAVSYGSSPTNTWVSLSSDRGWIRQPGNPTILAVSIREAASGTVLATCTITLTS